jgi:hypothetical protein
MNTFEPGGIASLNSMFCLRNFELTAGGINASSALSCLIIDKVLLPSVEIYTWISFDPIFFQYCS